MTLENLRLALGDAGFDEFVRIWLTDYAKSDISTAELTTIATQIAGQDMAAFFADWLLEADKPAWQSSGTTSLTTTVAAAAQGDTIPFTVSTLNDGNVPMVGSTVTVDVAGVLDQATIGTLPAEITVDGTVLSWLVPDLEVGATASVTFAATVAGDAAAGALEATLALSSLGLFCDTECGVSLALAAIADGPDAPPGAVLPATGLVSGPVQTLALGGLLIGAALLVVARPRRRVG
jgi:Domain of unknown function DUF11